MSKRFVVLGHARSGSTYLSSLLACHPKMHVLQEILHEIDVSSDLEIREIIESKFADVKKEYKGFKVLIETLHEKNLSFNTILNSMQAEFVIIIWRENFLETFVSLKIAWETKIWCVRQKNKDQLCKQAVRIDKTELEEVFNFQETFWRQIAKDFPLHIKPIFVKYEDLSTNQDKTILDILSQITIEYSHDTEYESFTIRQNPYPLDEKVENWFELPENLRLLKLNVPSIFHEEFDRKFNLPREKLSLVPDREPILKERVYQVAVPYIPSESFEYALEALDSKSISSASIWPKRLSQLIKALFKVPVAQPCSNGFSAMVLALQACNLNEHSEVICPSFTMVAVANAIAFVNAKPVFVDNGTNSYNPGWNEVENAITSKTKVVIICHTYGVVADDIELISKNCKKKGIILIEDISECIGIKTPFDGNRMCGTFGDIAIASLYSNKMVQAGDGGFVIAKNVDLLNVLESLVNHGFTKSYHFVHFQKCINGKINGLGAAIACGNFQNLENVLNHRKMITEVYRSELSTINQIKLMPKAGVNDTPWVFGLECESKEARTSLRQHLANFGIETRDYFFPLNLQPAYNSDYKKGEFPHAEALGSRGFYLPTHPNLNIEDVKYICSKIKSYFKITEDIPCPSRQENLSVRLNKQSFKIEVFKYDKDLNKHICRNHQLEWAYFYHKKMENYFIKGNWNLREELLIDLKDFFDKSKNYPDIELYFRPFMDYLENHRNEELSLVSPWVAIDLKSEQFKVSNIIPTTTETETLQLLCWLVKTKHPKNVLEVGCLLGHTALKMHEASEDSINIFAVDNFETQPWMMEFVKKCELMQDSNNSFLKTFLQNVSTGANNIHPLKLSISENLTIPSELLGVKFDLVFFDFTRDSEELEVCYNLFKPSFTPFKTIIVINSINYSLLHFLNKYNKELLSYAKPFSSAKAFVYSPQQNSLNTEVKAITKFNFKTNAEWRHLHGSCFEKAILLLKDKFHDENAKISFIDAVENTLSNDINLFLEPWIGIIHNCEYNPDLFYSPDHIRLNNELYKPAMRACKGLFTLTTHQAEFLRKNLNYKIPITRLFYPLLIPKDEHLDLIYNKKRYFMKAFEDENQIIDLVSIGNYVRDFEYFFTINVDKKFRKCILAPGDLALQAINKSKPNIHVINYLNESDYELLLSKCVVFLSLKYIGAANTIILECIARNTPILIPNMDSCVEYLGETYPLIYSKESLNFENLMSSTKIVEAINYLESMDKTKFSLSTFIADFQKSIVLKTIPSEQNSEIFSRYDVTISICSYRRTHHLKKILDSLWHHQTFKGRIEIIIWNNNPCRKYYLDALCKDYLRLSGLGNKRLVKIDSNNNYYCTIRLALAHLMQSDKLIICDDDVIPGNRFVEFFMAKTKDYPNDVICTRGHLFLPHKLNYDQPENFWTNYDSLRFISDEKNEQLIHFAHFDACLIPQKLLLEANSVQFENEQFKLVDDYWLSYILNAKFKRNLRKLKVNVEDNIFRRTEDSDQPILALHTRDEVKEARLMLYIHHMLNGWPNFDTVLIDDMNLRNLKQSKWDNTFLGFNVSSNLNEDDLNFLKSIGVKVVRIGAVGVGKDIDFEFASLASEPFQTILKLKALCDKLKANDICVIFTLDRRVATAENWKLISKELALFENVIGYDLVNEPYNELDEELHWKEIDNIYNKELVGKTVLLFEDMILNIRKHDQVTPIILEPTFYGSRLTIPFLVDKLKERPILDQNIILSYHFYEPCALTLFRESFGDLKFPGHIPVYKTLNSETIYWDKEFIKSITDETVDYAFKNGFKVFIGEFGCPRVVKGALNYLKACMEVYAEKKLSSCIFSFRDVEWDKMDYEFGSDKLNYTRLQVENNEMFKEIVQQIQKRN